MNRLFKTSLLVAAMLPAIAVAAPVAGDREVTLGGAGSSDKDFDDTVLSVQGSWGTYLDEASMWGVRQTVNARDSEGESVQFDGSTRVFYDYHFGSGNTRPFVGVSVGGIYGEEVDETFMGGPEVGIKYWVQDKTFITAMAEYQFLFKSGSDARDRYDDGAFFYSVGIGYNY
ncbi:hypothetical protein [Stutzerimonas zhaodongensis]|jgi:hypothetical protein|uniref:Outer membrane protein beta-barrel domain-containing protein n=2 Tax=Stutzerimonas zhaodongensis TaxID=1176257 RepID=A0ABX8ITW1_9GAMM|nr:hypothetical protein [Stutzerimonas zhaodongensis]QWV16635.1 hypothetical protein KQ248_19535 [Stutzerimonas zhaodongensis]